MMAALYPRLTGVEEPSRLPCHARMPVVQGPVVFRRAVFVPPGYTSLLFAHLYEESSCPLRTTLFAGFRRFFLSSFGLDDQQQQADAAVAAGSVAVEGKVGVGGDGRGGAGVARAGAGGIGSLGAEGDAHRSDSTLTIRLISRRPGPGKARMARQIGNEEELVAELRVAADEDRGGGGSAVSVGLLDFAQLTGD